MMPRLSFKDSIEVKDILIPDDSSHFFIDVKGKTHIGRIRDENQDNLKILLPPSVYPGVVGVLSVADGMGGHQGGAEASKIAINSFAKSVTSPLTTRSTKEITKNAFRSANNSIFLESKVPELSGMGTTLTSAIITSNGVTIGHVGDSRAYLLRDSKLHQLTNDHTWIADQINKGKLSGKQAQSHPKRNMLTRAVGIMNEIEIDISSFSMQNHDTLLICSDGLHGQINNLEIENILNQKQLEIIVDLLVKSANKSGGIDNVTVLVANFTAQKSMQKPNYGFLSLFFKEEKESKSILETVDRLGFYTDLEPMDKVSSRNIYKAWDPNLKKQVIVKANLKPKHEKLHKEFDIENEAKCHSQIKHPNIVNLISYELNNNPPYLVLEYLSGGSLKEKIERNGPLKIKEMLIITKEILSGLDAIHNKNLIHCDIKPENILFDYQGIPKLIDFSLARDLRSSKNIPKTGSVLWVSPEQWSGHILDIRSEIYSIGGLMHYIATGLPPFFPDASAENERDSVREKHLNTQIPDATAKNPLIPSVISYCIAKCLAKIPERRFQSISSLAYYLDNHKNIDTISEKWEYFNKPNLLT